MVKMVPGGFLVIFDGIDGVGKTTQLQLAQAALSKAGWTCQSKRNLGGTPIGEELRKVMLRPIPRPTETNLYISAAIQEALIRAMAEERERGGLILMDRGPLSLAAYEIFGSGLAEDLGWPQVDNGMRALKPELTVVYTAEITRALERAKKQSGKPDYFESKPLDYFERVANGYKVGSQRYDKIVTIDANEPIEDVHKQTMKVIQQALDAHGAH